VYGFRNTRQSPELLDTIYLCQQRQEWYREFARLTDEEPRRFVGAADLTGDVKKTAGEMRNALKFDVEERRRIPTWTDALRLFIEQADALGILVMVSSVVGNNNRRKLDTKEFRGFALVDDLAPLVFINGADSKAAQMFTLAHELAHLWLGESALSDLNPEFTPSHEVEKWCNRVAAELLVPIDIVQNEFRSDTDFLEEMNRLARRFKVSTLVILRRMHDFHALNREEFQQIYEKELERLQSISRPGGGDFYLTQAARIGKRFVRALVMSTLEGCVSYAWCIKAFNFS
jgi:Zn-dependent peptidase ImmA (M78 family)